MRDNELSGFTRRRKLDNPTNVSIEIAQIAFDLFKRNYSWPKPLRGIGVRGADLCPADCAVQLGFFRQCRASRHGHSRAGGHTYPRRPQRYGAGQRLERQLRQSGSAG